MTASGSLKMTVLGHLQDRLGVNHYVKTTHHHSRHPYSTRVNYFVF
jgi:hypothetical protein